MRAHLLWVLATATAFAVSAVACGSDGGDGDGDGDGDGTGSDGDGPGATSGCVNEACDAASSGQPPGPCPTAVQVTYPMGVLSGPSMCEGYGPDECAVVGQDGCEVTVECTGFSALTVTIDAAGVSQDLPIPIGDGITANCHIEVGASPPSLSLSCSAQGVTCEWGGSLIDCLEDDDCPSFQCVDYQCIP